jgi:hypothetical protein
MKKLTILNAIITGLVTLSASNAFAAWTEIGQNEQSTISVDTATLQAGNSTAQILSMLDFKKPGEDPKTKEPVNSIIGLNEFDCSNAKYRPLEFKVFTGNKGSGKVLIDQQTPDSIYEVIPQGHWAAGVYNIVCKAK